MNDILKQRLVGALILVALGVVFWPIVFVEPDAGAEIAESQSAVEPPGLPAEANALSVEVGSTESTESVADGIDQAVDSAPVSSPTAQNVEAEGASATPADSVAETVVPVLAPDASKVRSAASPGPATQSDTGRVEWTLQVATVSSVEKAESLRRQLQELKHKVYVTTVRAGGKSLYRVCIGPTLVRGELEKLQASINARFGVTSMVARYTP